MVVLVVVQVAEGHVVAEEAVVAEVVVGVVVEEEPNHPQLKSWMLSLKPMSTRSTSEVIGGQESRPSYTLSWLLPATTTVLPHWWHPQS